jgi:hypothetical protein
MKEFVWIKRQFFSKFGFQASRWTKLRQRNHNGHDQSSYQIWKLSDQQYQRSFIHKVKWDGQNSQTEKLHVYVLILYFLLFYAGEFRPTPTFEGSQKIEGCSRVWSWGIRISIFDLLTCACVVHFMMFSLDDIFYDITRTILGIIK